jgi:hypothetical protein
VLMDVVGSSKGWPPPRAVWGPRSA